MYRARQKEGTLKLANAYAVQSTTAATKSGLQTSTRNFEKKNKEEKDATLYPNSNAMSEEYQSRSLTTK